MRRHWRVLLGGMLIGASMASPCSAGTGDGSSALPQPEMEQYSPASDPRRLDVMPEPAKPEGVQVPFVEQSDVVTPRALPLAADNKPEGATSPALSDKVPPKLKAAGQAPVNESDEIEKILKEDESLKAPPADFGKSPEPEVLKTEPPPVINDEDRFGRLAPISEEKVGANNVSKKPHQSERTDEQEKNSAPKEGAATPEDKSYSSDIGRRLPPME